MLGELGFAPRFLTKDQIASFVANGVLVVPGVLSDDALANAKCGMAATLLAQGVDLGNLEATVHGLGALSSTGGAGGVLDVFYPSWKLRATLDSPNYHHAMTDLYQATYARAGAERDLWSHPYGDLDGSRAFAHVDRIGCRVPDAVSQRGPRKRDAVQRSLTPHLDCCPTSLHGGGGKQYVDGVPARGLRRRGSAVRCQFIPAKAARPATPEASPRVVLTGAYLCSPPFATPLGGAGSRGGGQSSACLH